jgi:transcriptional regulator with XRE-family HTH domain
MEHRHKQRRSAERHPALVPTFERPATQGAARSRQLRQAIGEQLATSRRSVGLSLREVGRKVGVGPQRIARAERGDPAALTLDLAARMAPMVGLRLAASLYPSGDPIRDRAHLRLIQRFRARLHPSLRWRVEVPLPIVGDLRSADGLIDGSWGDALVEAETHVGDVQAVERRVALKQRDLGTDRAILLVAETAHNRTVLREHPELRERFPIDTRTCLARLGRGEDPGGDALVVL